MTMGMAGVKVDVADKGSLLLANIMHVLIFVVDLRVSPPASLSASSSLAVYIVIVLSL